MHNGRQQEIGEYVQHWIDANPSKEHHFPSFWFLWSTHDAFLF